ncbi:hypothetical protein HPB50_012606 [Hyalomma asiaticum]|uniref:Uncharacterized protein n=1 Tax=Hyalomma asiaticum TaxID=266040 RepID=A0ACB7RKW7_HYAAI|nr:hypothetical protein HPB50_012606 [Hyalomma asiaticum]
MAPIDPLWCRVNRTQYLSSDGWVESRGPSSSSPAGVQQPFALYQASNRTFLQWLGDEHERRTLQHKLLLLRVRCADKTGAVFEPCIAFRAGWAPGIAPVERRTTDFTVVGLCLGVLGLAYVLAVLVYLRVRQGSVKSTFRSYLNEQPANGQYHAYDTPRSSGSDSSTRDVFFKRSASLQQLQKQQQQQHGAATSSGDAQQQAAHLQHLESRSSVRRAALQMNLGPELLEPEMLACPPPPAQEFLTKVREMVAAARARLRNFRFRPTLVDIPEDDYTNMQHHQHHQHHHHQQLQHGHHQFAKNSDCGHNPAGICNGACSSAVRHNPLLGVDRFFEVNESYQDSPLEALAHVSPYPPRPPERRRKKACGKEAPQARFDLFRKDLYEKLQKLQEGRSQPSGIRCEPDGNSDSPSYENVLPAPLPKRSQQEAPPRPPPRLSSSPVEQSPRPEDLEGDDVSSTSIELDSLYSPWDSLNSRNLSKLSVPPDQTLLEALDEPIIFDSLHEPRPTYIVNSGRLSQETIVSMSGSFKPPRAGLYMSVESLQNCIKTGPRFGPCKRGFDAMDALRRVTAGDMEFMHVCRGHLRRRDSIGCSSVASDSLVPSPSDSEYDPDYSDPSPRTDARVTASRRARRRLRSRAERNGKHSQPFPSPPDVTIIEVGDAAGDILNGKGNFVTLIELDTSESSN